MQPWSQPLLWKAATASLTCSFGTVTFDPASPHNATLSGGNLIVTNTGTTSTDQGAMVAAANGYTTNKYYFEYTVTTLAGGGGVGTGIGNTTSTYSGMSTNVQHGVTVFVGTGNVWVDTSGNTGYNIGTIVGGSTIGVAVDLINYRVWFRLGASGLWNGTSGHDPTIGDGTHGGFGITAGTIIPIVTFGSGLVGPTGISGNVITANFGASPFVGAVPSGYYPGWCAPVACDPYFGNVVLLMGYEGANGSTGAPGMTDESPAAHGTATVTGASKITTSQFKFGASSLLCGAAISTIDFTYSANWNFGSSAFTVECFIYPSALSGNQYIVCQWANAGTNLGWALILAAAVPTFNISTTSTNTITVASGGTVTTGAWQHVAVDYDGVKYRLYLNGAMVGSSTTPQTINASTLILNVGSNNIGNFTFSNSEIDELRITKGVARYASDGVVWTSRSITTQAATISDSALSSVGTYVGSISLSADPTHANWTDIILEIKASATTPPAFVNSGSMTSVLAAPSGTPALPVSRTNGNLLIAYCRSAGATSANTLSVSAGWTIGYATRQGNPRPSIVTYCYVTGSETAPTFTSSIGNDNFEAQVLQYTGAIGSSPFGNNAVGWHDGATGFDGGLNAPMRCPSMTSAFANSTALNIALINPSANAEPSTPTSSSFAVPTAAFPRVQCPDPHFGQVVLLMGYEGANGSTGAPGMTDESPSVHGNANVVGAAQISTTQEKFGASSLSLNGTNSQINFAYSNDWNLGAGPFTIECWIYPTTISGTQFIVGPWQAAPNLGWTLVINGPNIEFHLSTTGSDNLAPVINLSSITANTWYSVAVDYDGIKYRMYVNGTTVSTSATTHTIYNPSLAIGIGANSSGNGSFLAGYIDELRITKGFARYASDSGYTVPASAFPRS